ncbi:MAG: 50S ribosomal protein L9 [bacterium]|nr:50S ribosomal protein L9 [bacterium]MDZ4343344.1 50S ribosomal protein L9 [Candidatus Binatia bacterium]
MSKKVQVILLENIASLGRAGDIVVVSEGHARNFLFPQSKAALADSKTQKQQTQRLAKKQAESSAETKAWQEQAELLSRAELSLVAAIKDGDDIFGTITPAVIAKELTKQAGISVKASQITTEEPIKKIGGYNISVNLSPDVEANLRLNVTAKPGTGPSKDEED